MILHCMIFDYNDEHMIMPIIHRFSLSNRGWGGGLSNSPKEPEKLPMPRRHKFIRLFVFFTMINIPTYWLQSYVNDKSYEETHCGIVRFKNNHDNYSKHGNYSSTTYFFLINFEKVGLRDLDVTRSTYFTHDLNDRVCFKFRRGDLYGGEGWVVLIIFWYVVQSFVLIGAILWASSKE